MRVCVITDNSYIYEEFLKIVENQEETFDFYYSLVNKNFAERYRNDNQFNPIKLSEKDNAFFDIYDLFISLHCKQLFPKELVNNHRCLNVHPGLNPYNRGWFPQVFSIINKKPIGVTIHEMDEELDHGPIILQKPLKIYSYDTSYDVYRRIQQTEIELIKDNLSMLVHNNYTKVIMQNEGNINYKSDFDKLCMIDLDELVTYGQVIDLLRATTFQKYNNAYFYDEDGCRIYISINLKKVEE